MNANNAIAAALINAGVVPSSTDNKAADKAAKAAKGKTQPGKAAPDPEAAALIKATATALGKWGRLDGNTEASLLDVFRAVSHGGVTSPAMVAKAAPHLSEGSAMAYSATFNKAAKAAALIRAPTLSAPISAAAFDQLILNLQRALGLTVFLITHDLDTLYTICNRVAVLADGKVLVNAPLEEVERFDHPWVQEYFHGPRGRAAQSARDAHASGAGGAPKEKA